MNKPTSFETEEMIFRVHILQWAKTCAEVSKLKITRKVVDTSPTSNHAEPASRTAALATAFATASAPVENDNESILEAAGVELSRVV